MGESVATGDPFKMSSTNSRVTSVEVLRCTSPYTRNAVGIAPQTVRPVVDVRLDEIRSET